MIYLFPYRLTYDFSILAKNYHTKSTGATICYIGYPTRNEKHIKYVKNTKILRNQRGNFKKVGGNKQFPKIGGKCTILRKWGILNFESMTKNRSSEMLADENRHFLGKGQIRKIFHGV